jgi:Carboxypeptidase regulatory-like domain
MRQSAAVVLLLSLGCGDGNSPVQPTPPLPAPTPQVFSLSGSVRDTASRPLGGSRVEVIDGQGAAAGTTTTDEAGRFWLPGTFTGMVTVTASKDGYIPETATVAPRHPLPPLPPGEVGRFDISLSLEPRGPSANIAGVYTLTLTADSACTNLPDEARTRTYTATIVPGYRSTTFLGRLSDARIVSLPFSPYFEIGIAGDFANASVRIVEQLGETTYLAIEGGAAVSVGPSGFTAPFSSYFLHCPNEPAWSSGEYWWCGAGVQGVECNSPRNQLTLVRR